jgi:hypothetical protein
MDRTSFADPDRLSVLMTEPSGLKVELTLQMIESFPFDGTNPTPTIFVIHASQKLDILCLQEHRTQLLHLYHISRTTSGFPVFKEMNRISAISAAAVTVHKSMRLLVLSPDLILRIHAPWCTRLNIVFPSTRPWKSISQVNGNRITLSDLNAVERYHLDLIPQNRLVEWCLDVLECLLDSSLYALFLSVYGNARLKTSTSDTSAFIVTLFACFLAIDNRSPSPSPRPTTELKSDNDAWQTMHLALEQSPSLNAPPASKLLSLLPQSREFVHHFEGKQRASHCTVILLALHSLSEELRLHTGMNEHNKLLVPLLCQLSHWLGRTKFVEYYTTSDIHIADIEFDKRTFSGLGEGTLAKEDPWSIYQWLISSIQATSPRVNDDLLTLDVLLLKISDKTPPLEKLSTAKRLLPSIEKLRNIYPLLNLRDFRSSFVAAMEDNGVTKIWLDSLPVGVAYPLKIALSVCKRQPLSTWTESTYDLIDRKDLVELLRMAHSNSEKLPTYIHPTKNIDEVSTVTEICQQIQSPEVISSGPTLADDHENITNLIFRNDRRMLEVHKLLEYSQPGVTFWFRASPTITYFPLIRVLM